MNSYTCPCIPSLAVMWAHIYRRQPLPLPKRLRALNCRLLDIPFHRHHQALRHVRSTLWQPLWGHVCQVSHNLNDQIYEPTSVLSYILALTLHVCVDTLWPPLYRTHSLYLWKASCVESSWKFECKHIPPVLRPILYESQLYHVDLAHTHSATHCNTLQHTATQSYITWT